MHDILHRVGANAKPEAVFAALTTIDGLRSWWISGTTGAAAAGGLIDFGFSRMKVLAADPHTLVHWQCVSGPDEWVGTDITFKLEWKRGQTFILFKHANWKEPVEFMHHCSTKWAVFLLSLKDAIEHGKGQPTPRDVKIHVGD